MAISLVSMYNEYYNNAQTAYDVYLALVKHNASFEDVKLAEKSFKKNQALVYLMYDLMRTNDAKNYF